MTDTLLFFALMTSVLAIAALVGYLIRPPRFNVADYGAKGDGLTDNTDALKRAVDDCYQAGGGEVYFPEGSYRTSSLEIHEGVSLGFSDKQTHIGG